MKKWIAVLPAAALVLAVGCGDESRLPTGLPETPVIQKPVFDGVSNNLDASIDAVAEVMSLTVGGANGTTQLYVNPTNGDGKNGCNLTGSTTLVVSVSSNNTSVATVSPSSVTFGSCGDTPTLTVTPVSEGSATISIAQTTNSTDGTFDLAPATFTVNVSAPPNTAPSISVTGVTGGASYEIGSVPDAECSVTDAEDGNSTFAATLSAISGPLSAYGLGERTASCSYTDGGGLLASGSVTYGIVDTTDPVITFVSRTAANGNGWNNGDVTVNWSCSDSGSGVVAASVSKTVSTEGADQSTIGTCADHAGNTASDTQTGINIDKTDPVVGVTGVSDGATYILGSVPVAGCSTTDALSDVATAATLGVSGGPLGSITATCSGALDKAGNAGSASVTYNVIYAWTGFFRPVENLPITNVAKAGSAIPVKFHLGGDQGLLIFEAGYPASGKIVCSATAEAEAVDETVTAGSSSLSYDPVAGQYIYVWKTDKGWAGTCRQLQVRLIDGTMHTARFSFSK